MESRVTEDMNGELTRPFAEDEITFALKQMHPLKSPGPDEALSHLIRQAKSQGTIQGISISSQAPRVSHLLFADDTMIFCKATPTAILDIQGILKLFERAFGYKINLEKSAIVFSHNTPVQNREILANVLRVMVKDKHDKYLDLPSTVGQSKCELFEGLKDRIWLKINSWAMKKLSQVGHAVLLKSVLQAIPSYIMMCFDIPEGILSELEAMMANFFWQYGGETKIH
ncbi:UNVERIFIED_CONTAM: hypothetical protein Slati_1485200 [Sesamum latifolium]|uniref:Reverse transcriptase domain-containing protein n=1 Tax=Sesamum latifolium TaxID=2727402 RepID=A0AAW2X6A7_9LAMI